MHRPNQETRVKIDIPLVKSEKLMPFHLHRIHFHSTQTSTVTLITIICSMKFMHMKQIQISVCFCHSSFTIRVNFCWNVAIGKCWQRFSLKFNVLLGFLWCFSSNVTAFEIVWAQGEAIQCYCPLSLCYQSFVILERSINRKQNLSNRLNKQNRRKLTKHIFTPYRNGWLKSRTQWWDDWNVVIFTLSPNLNIYEQSRWRMRTRYRIFLKISQSDCIGLDFGAFVFVEWIRWVIKLASDSVGTARNDLLIYYVWCFSGSQSQYVSAHHIRW